MSAAAWQDYRMSNPEKTRGLASLSQSIFASLGLPATNNDLSLGDNQRVALVLIDGLGYNSLLTYQDQFPIFKTLCMEKPLNSHFPTTTATNLVSLGTGELPGVHGMLGYTVRVPFTGDPGRLLNALKWDERVDPVIWQSVPTLYERAISHGVAVSHVAEKRFDGSGFTRAGARGATYRGANSLNDMVLSAVEAHRSARSYSFIYLNNIDKSGHSEGVGSDKWLAALDLVAQLLTALIERLPPDTQIYLTSDHGMVNVDEKVILGAESALLENVTLIGGEARARHIYLRAGSELDTAEAWRHYFGDKVEIFTKADAHLLFGEVVTDSALARMGDLIAVPRGGLVLLDPAIADRESKMVGHHGGFTQDEVLIPLLSYRT